MAIALITAAAAVVAGAVIAMAVKDQTYVASPTFRPSAGASRDNAVVYYSRSGHSEAVAREVAKRLDAPIARIDADYPLSFQGQAKAIADAKAEIFPTIKVETLDLRPAKRVYLVSPTWMFRPAPPMWAFVSQSDLSGKAVVLVMTGNSRFKQEEIDRFARLIESRGGHLIHHTFIRRGRFYWQLDRDELLDRVNSSMKELAPEY